MLGTGVLFRPDPKVRKANRDAKEFKVSKGHLAREARKAFRANKGILARKANPACRDRKALRVKGAAG